MGALVQVLANDSMVGTAFTDLHGRYLIGHLVPGKYDVKASAALFIPSTRGNLQLRPGARAVVNLTLNTLFETAAWLPAERRKADEPADDWKWTLRSAANRPILRLVEDGDSVMISSSLTEQPNKPVERARGAVTAGDGGFGSNGLHNVFTLNRVLDDGANVILRADYGSTGRPFTGGPSTEIATGYERQLGFAGAARTLVSYQSHPEMVGSGHVSGLGAMQLASAQRMKLGDTVDVEVGSNVYVVRSSSYTTAARPFVKMTVHPSEAWTVGYRMATSRDLQSFADLDAVQQELPVAVVSQGRMRTERGLHHEFSVGRKAGPGVIQVAYYLDSLDRVVVSGGGALSAADIEEVSQSSAGGILADATTGNFRILGNGYKAQGVNVMLTEPLSPGMWVALTYSTGAALTAQDAGASDTARCSDRPGTGDVSNGHARPEGKGESIRNQDQSILSLAAGAAGDGGQPIRRIQRPGLLQLLSAAGDSPGQPSSGRARGDRRCYQSARTGISPRPDGRWAHPVPRAKPHAPFRVASPSPSDLRYDRHGPDSLNELN